MCGIAGIFSSNPSDLDYIKLLTNAMSHRGPDAEAYYHDSGVALGHRRLSIIDLSNGANQPMLDTSGNLVIVYNGELYNYKEIRQLLEPKYNFVTSSDTEVILAAYICLGPDCLKLFNGIFAFVIYNKVEKELFIARDPLGIKPLYFYRGENKFIFASEIKALIKSGLVKAKLSFQGLSDFLMYQSVHEPNSMVSGVFQIRAGHYVLVQNAKFIVKPYWSFTDTFYSNFSSYEDTCAQVRDRFFNAVSKQMVSDVPVATFLSGGIDSSAISVAAAKVSTQSINTFSVVFDEPEFDESNFSRLMSKKLKSNHHEIRVKPSIFIEQLSDALSAMSTPSGDGPNSFLLSKVVHEAGIKVAISGLGGDELFAGYNHFNSYYKLQKFKNIVPVWTRQLMSGFLVDSTDRKKAKVGKLLSLSSFDIQDTYPIFRQIFSWKEVCSLNPILSNTHDVIDANLIQLKNELKKMPVYSQYSVAELQNYTMNVLLEDVDQMSMANSLEVRVPFLDKDFVQFTLSIPDKWKHPTSPKKLLVDALGNDLPQEIINRPKMGFNFPWDKWMRNELKDFCKKYIDNLAERALFNSDTVIFYWNNFIGGNRSVQWFKIWLLVVLEHWIEMNEVEI